MVEKLEVFRMSHAMAVHAGARQAVVAQNLANADTPGYAAQDIKPFQTMLETQSDRFALRATRPGHLNAPSLTLQFEPTEVRDAEADPNGNTVSLELEMLKAVDIKRQHDQSLAIYKSSLGILRAAIGRG